MNSSGDRLYRARFQWQPTLTEHDPANILTLEDVPPQTYAVQGAAALTFAVAGSLAATSAQPAGVALELVVAATVEYVAAPVEEGAPPGGGWFAPRPSIKWIDPPKSSPPPRPKLYSLVGSAAFVPGWVASADCAAGHAAGSGRVEVRWGMRPAAVYRTRVAHRRHTLVWAPRRSGSARVRFDVSPTADEWLALAPGDVVEALLSEEELAYAG